MATCDAHSRTFGPIGEDPDPRRLHLSTRCGRRSLQPIMCTTCPVYPVPSRCDLRKKRGGRPLGLVSRAHSVSPSRSIVESSESASSPRPLHALKFRVHTLLMPTGIRTHLPAEQMSGGHQHPKEHLQERDSHELLAGGAIADVPDCRLTHALSLEIAHFSPSWIGHGRVAGIRSASAQISSTVSYSSRANATSCDEEVGRRWGESAACAYYLALLWLGYTLKINIYPTDMRACLRVVPLAPACSNSVRPLAVSRGVVPDNGPRGFWSSDGAASRARRWRIATASHNPSNRIFKVTTLSL
ncbi:hypothetical protein B0H13DRAFT_2665572 [Mycena leptocephala]|nr:hypothetical protein B0H13DRAFT_2665572 [Mycena leptocephala]